MISRAAAVTVLALFGLFIAAGVTFAASKLVSQPIGLSYHQRSLDDSLAPTKTITVTHTVTTVGSAAGDTSPGTTPALPVQSSGAPSTQTSGAAPTSGTSTDRTRSTTVGSGADRPVAVVPRAPENESGYGDGHSDADHDD